MTAPDTATIVVRAAPARAGSASQSLASSRKKSRFVRSLRERAWVHVVLLIGIALFLFPFVYMVATSLKTDEELTESQWFPSVPQFNATSPYVRESPRIIRPDEAPADKWE